MRPPDQNRDCNQPPHAGVETWLGHLILDQRPQEEVAVAVRQEEVQEGGGGGGRRRWLPLRIRLRRQVEELGTGNSALQLICNNYTVIKVHY